MRKPGGRKKAGIGGAIGPPAPRSLPGQRARLDLISYAPEKLIAEHMLPAGLQLKRARKRNTRKRLTVLASLRNKREHEYKLIYKLIILLSDNIFICAISAICGV